MILSKKYLNELVEKKVINEKLSKSIINKQATLPQFDVFISYSYNDVSFAEKIVNLLE